MRTLVSEAGILGMHKELLPTLSCGIWFTFHALNIQSLHICSRYPIQSPRGQAMSCTAWVQTLICVLHLSLQCGAQHPVKLAGMLFFILDYVYCYSKDFAWLSSDREISKQHKIFHVPGNVVPVVSFPDDWSMTLLTLSCDLDAIYTQEHFCFKESSPANRFTLIRLSENWFPRCHSSTVLCTKIILSLARYQNKTTFTHIRIVQFSFI